ncbi:hypothetical protein JFU37_18355 [Pseudomonas sp. TH41]|uniref:hypothetical protein n=1 Tax=Pseudomonas sp. TH41 TaxID=2796405 RepID=UPI0019139EE2|nr:hypothetical protein [Pseudomonas sp. TH41]MBK5354455.1 hypothetical protein [Pseudomonas sp. TH41]
MKASQTRIKNSIAEKGVTIDVAAVEHREAAFGGEAVVIRLTRFARKSSVAGFTTASPPNAASRCSTAATEFELSLK